MPASVTKRQLPLLVFSHGNSFGASTYAPVLHSLALRGYQLAAIEKFGHDPAYPVTSNWPHLVQQLAEFVQTQASQAVHARAPVVLVGHSLGGFLSLMCAAQHPQLAGGALAGVVLLDSPIISGWRALVLALAKKTGLVERLGPGVVSKNRKCTWDSAEAAFTHFRGKKAFARWGDEALRCYATTGTVADGNVRRLAFDRMVETAIYNSLPHNLGRLMAKHPPQCPVAFIGGQHSVEVKKVGLAMTQRITQGRVRMVSGSHLFPIEHPLETATAIEAALASMGVLQP